MIGTVQWIVGSGSLEAVVPTLLGVAGISVLARRRLPRSYVWTAFVLSVSLAVGLELIRLWPTSLGASQDLARVCGVLAFLWCACASVAQTRAGANADPIPSPTGFATTAYVVALLLGVVVAVVQSVVLMIQIIYVSIDLIQGYTYAGHRSLGFGLDGIWSLGFVYAACILSWISTGHRHLGACQLWCAVGLVTWACLIAPVLDVTATGGSERTGGTIVLAVLLAAVLMTTVSISGRIDRRRLCGAPGSWGADDTATADASAWPGLALSVTLVALAVILLACFHLIVPIPLWSEGFRLSSLIVSLAAAGTALACFRLYGRTRHTHLAEAAMGLMTFAICGFATLAVPSRPVALADRYPLVFNAMTVGFGISTALWAWLAPVGTRSRHDRRSETAAARLVPQLKRFAFLSAALALLVSAIMAIWPRLPSIATMDDTLGRVTAGFAANLFLLLVMLWSSRRLRRFPFQMLTVMTVITAAAFLLARILPLTPQYG